VILNAGRGWSLAAVALVVAVLLTRSLRSPDEDNVPVKRIVIPVPPAAVVVVDTLSRGETLGEILDERGFDGGQAYELVQAIREVKSPRTFRAGLLVRFEGQDGAAPSAVSLQLNGDSLLHLTRTDSVWTSTVRTIPVRIDTVLLSGTIESSLWFAELDGEDEKLGEGEFKEYVFDLADVFAWKIDFTRDIRRGDAFRVAIERAVRPDGSVRSRRFLAVDLRNDGREYTAVPFDVPGDGRQYFEPDGAALRGVFLRYPVPFRITSSYNPRRYHPVLKVPRAHLGTDYGAPRGTPVKATSSGRVTRAGRWGGYGIMVEITHANKIVTRYAHLSGIASGIRAGVRVSQGTVIGRVGSTGLSTASHLHYEFLRAGRHVNPATINLPSAPGLAPEMMDDFAVIRDEALALLQEVPMPGTRILSPAGGIAVAD
jgi:murein DD-endopeptidase MepM/ murein hydrolase activator NlpD